MKKVLYFAAAALALAACSKTEVIEENLGEAINFRTVVNGNTKAYSQTTVAHDVTTANLSEFIVTARTASADYFTNVEYQKDGTTFTSANKYYWPATGDLTFYAYAPKGATGVTRSAYNTWAVTQQTTPSNQPDLVVAVNTGNKTSNASGVALNFRHSMSKLSVKVKNSNTGMKMVVKNWKVAYLTSGETLTVPATVTTGSGLLATSVWSSTDANKAVSNAVNNGDDLAGVTITANTTTAGTVTGFGDFIVIPQAMTVPTSPAKPAYASTSANANWDSSYIAVLMEIQNTTDDTTIAAEQWCCWPISTTLEPGKHYTYTIDLADGGYKEKNVVNADPETTALDPVLDNAEIKFITVTVDDWTEADGTVTPVA